MHGFAVVPRPSYVSALDPIKAAEGGFPASVSEASNPQPSAAVRTLLVSPGSVQMIEGGLTVQTARLDQPSLSSIVAAVRNRSWIAEPRRGVFVLATPLIFSPGAVISISRPAVRSIELDGSVFLAFDRDTVTLSGVSVSSRDATRSTPLAPHFRPFVEFTGSSVSISGARFSRLGWDWNASYGVSLMSHSTGVVRNSTFDGNFIGVYVDHSQGISILGNRFLHNDLYGLDPHSFSSGLRIIGNTADFNAAHGIVFSNHVTASDVLDNVTAFNGENGIMMDELSNHNVISGNESAHNLGDGIVLSSSSGNEIEHNRVSDNRIGINLYGSTQSAPAVIGNMVTHNVLASQGFSFDPSSNTASGNVAERDVPPPAWHVVINFGLWPIFLLLALVGCLLRVGERRRLPPRQANGMRLAAAIPAANASPVGVTVPDDNPVGG